MDHNRITFVLNDNTYSLAPNDSAAIRDIPEQDRRDLIRLLEAVRREDATVQAKAREADARAKALLEGSAHTPGGPVQHTPSPERLGSGDADALMARLAMEEQISRKPGMTKQGLYKMALGFLAAVGLLVIIF